jgi:integrase
MGATRNESGLLKLCFNLWRIRARVRVNGKIKQIQAKFEGTKEQAKARRAVLIAQVREGRDSGSLTIRPDMATFRDLLETYKSKRGELLPPDISRLNLLFADLGDIRLVDFADRFESYLVIYRRTPLKKTGRVPSNATINRLAKIVRTAFNLGVQLEILEKNPITKYRFPTLKEIPRDTILDDAARQRLMDVIDRNAPHLGPVIRYALQVPCRKSELINMRREDLDLTYNAIRVRNGTTKNDAGCWKPIPPDMLDYFRDLPPDTDYLFYRRGNGACCPLGDFKRAWNTCLRLAGIKNYHVHDTRHQSATALLDNGTPEQVVLSVAGWKTNMLRTYYHREPKRALQLVNFGNCANNVKTLAAADQKQEALGTKQVA